MTHKPAKRARRGAAPAAREPQQKDSAKDIAKDIAILHGPTDDGQGARLLRLKDGEVWSGEVRPAREGQAIGNQELVRLRPLHPRFPICEVEVLHAPAAPAEAEGRPSAGPARVSNERYRQNWNTIFGTANRKAKTRTDWSLN